jgi:hypothetical protein
MKRPLSRALPLLPAALVAALVALATACSQAPSDARVGIYAPDGSEAVFGPVANYLGHRCGTIDCHGNEHRNLRIYSCNGLRAVATDVAECSRRRGGRTTTEQEHVLTYRSLVGLEPSAMTEVVAGGGADPDLLTFYRKARGIENHAGNQLIVPGDDQDVCVTSWLAGRTNLTACNNALALPSFQGFPAQ